MDLKNKPIMDQDLQIGLNKLTSKIGDVDIKVSGVLSLLKGNELDKDDRGLLGEVSEIKKEMENLKDFKKKVIYVALGASLPASLGLLEFIRQVMQKIAN
jgi:hypothetical protein